MRTPSNYRRIDREAYQLLSALQRGASLGIALESAFADSAHTAEEQAAKIQEYFAHARRVRLVLQVIW